jgi:PAS domain S-box-containing protein
MNPEATRWPSSRALAVGYVIAIAAIVVNTLITFSNLQVLRTAWDTFEGGRHFVRGIDSVLSDLKDAETGQRGYLLTGDERYLEPYTKSHAAIPDSIDRLRRLAGDSGTRPSHLIALSEAASAKLAELEHSIAVRKHDGLEAAVALVKTGRGKDAMDRVRRELASLRAEENITRDALRLRLRTSLTRTIFTFAFASALALALLFGVHFLSSRSQDQFRRHTAWLSTTLRSIGDAVIATNVDGRIIFMNEVAETLTGWPRAEAGGRPLEEVFRIVNEETRTTIDNPVSKALQEGTIVGLANHTLLIARDNREFAIEDTAAPIREEGGAIMGGVLVFHHVGDRRKLERESLDQARRLVEADRLKDEFLAMLAHELRNPVAAIKNAIQLMRMPGVTTDHVDWSKDVIERQVKHLARLIDDLLDVSRITRGKIELRRERIDASSIIKNAVDSVKPLVEERRQDLTVFFTPGTLWCEVDPTRLEQMLVNLLTNAAKFTGPRGRIWLTARNDGDTISIAVKDDGIGIAADKLSEIFELFAQGDRTSARSEGGLGIGLTVVRRIALMHGGTVTATSGGLGRGSEFTLTLPAVSPPHQNRGERPPDGPSSFSSSRILIVDDNVDMAYGLARLLKLLGNDIRTTHDGPAAIAEVREFRPDHLLLDIGLPSMDGYEVARQLRSEGFQELVIIAISGYGKHEDLRLSQEAGIDYHMVKPVDYDALVALIGSTVRLNPSEAKIQPSHHVGSIR